MFIMKFVALAVAALAGVSNAVELRGKYTKDEKFTSKLMQNAKVYDRSTGTQRKVQEEDQQTLSAAHSVIFKSCETLSVQVDFEEDANGEDGGASAMNLTQLFQSGAIRSQQSFILFDVCLSDYCYNGDSSYRTTYIVDMASFIGAFVGFIPTKQAQYCEQGCEDNADFCSGMYGDLQQQDGGRRLDSNVFEYINCDRCWEYGCYDDDENESTSNATYSLEWIEAMSTCSYQADQAYYWNGTEVTMGFMCNEAGTGVEIAAFLDDTCTLYTNQVAYKDLVSDTDYAYWSNSVQHMEYMFSTGFSCYNPTVVYVNPYDEDQGTYDEEWYNQNRGDEDNQDGQVPDAAEWCQYVFQGNMQPAELFNCDANEGGRKLDQGQYQQQYSLAEDDVENIYAVCSALSAMGGQGEHLYDSSSSGSMYSYSGETITAEDSSESWGGKTQKMVIQEFEKIKNDFKKIKNIKISRGVIGTIIALASIALAVVLGIWMGRVCYSLGERMASDLLNEDTTKKAPLIKESEKISTGELA